MSADTRSVEKLAYQPISFRVTKHEAGVIDAIADRAVSVARRHGIEYTKLDASMDITAVHCNGNRLRLEELLSAPQFDFAHDVFGILRHIDRETGKLDGCFVPRYSEPRA